METASKLSHGKVVIEVVGGEEITMSEDYACPYCDYSLEELEPRIFSFNAPYGSCPDCKGLGVQYKINVDLVIPEKTWEQKIEDVKKYEVDIVVMGGDWAGSDKFDYLKDYCEVVYFPRTEGVSTSKIKKELHLQQPVNGINQIPNT